MTLPEVHLAEEAVTAYVDGLLAPAADERAHRHLRLCPECRAAVDAQREAKALIGAAPDPALPDGLLSRLLDVPMTADLGGPGPDYAELVLSADGAELGFAPARRPGFGPRLVERSRVRREPVGTAAVTPTAVTPVAVAPTAVAPTAVAPVAVAPTAVAPTAVAPTAVTAAVARRPVGAARPAGRSGPGRPIAPVAVPRRLRRGRRGLAVSLAGLAFGVIASAATTTAPGTAAPARPGTVIPGQVPAQLSTVNSGGSPLEASSFRFSGSSGPASLVGGREADAR